MSVKIENISSEYDLENNRTTLILSNVHPYFLDIWAENIYEGSPAGRFAGNLLIPSEDPAAKEFLSEYLATAKRADANVKGLKDVFQPRIAALTTKVEGEDVKFTQIKWATGLEYPVTILNQHGTEDNSPESSAALKDLVASGALVNVKVMIKAQFNANNKLKAFINLEAIQYAGKGPTLSASSGKNHGQAAAGFGAVEGAGLKEAGVKPDEATHDDGMDLDLDLG